MGRPEWRVSLASTIPYRLPVEPLAPYSIPKFLRHSPGDEIDMKKITSSVLVALVLCVAPAWAGENGKTEGLLGPLLVGPKITAGVPVPFRIGLEGKWSGLVGGGFDYGFFPSMSFGEATISANSWNLAARIYPFQESFYIGVAFGKQSLSGSMTDQINTGFTTESVTATAQFNQTFLAPQIGWRWVWDSGLFLGMELGVQIPMSSDVVISTNRLDLEALAEVAALKNDASSEAETYGNQVLPWIGLLQIGYFF
jgi:hypothetical protein